jgi:hypothetical protein
VSEATERRILRYLISLIEHGYIPLERTEFEFVVLEDEPKKPRL